MTFVDAPHARTGRPPRTPRPPARRRRNATAAVVAVLLLVVAAGFLSMRKRDDSLDVTAPAVGQGELGVTIGDPAAPDVVVVYEDFLCPFCGELELATRDDLARLAEAGEVLVEYRPFELLGHLGDYSARATNAFAVVLDAAGPEVGMRFHDLLFDHQPREAGPFPGNADLVDLAVAAGARESAVAPDITAMGESGWVDTATRSAAAAGVRSTPTILLNGEVFTAGRTVEELGENLVSTITAD